MSVIELLLHLVSYVFCKYPGVLQVSAVASEPEALLRRLPLAVTVHLLLLACYQAYEVRFVLQLFCSFFYGRFRSANGCVLSTVCLVGFLPSTVPFSSRFRSENCFCWVNGLIQSTV